MTPKLFLVDLTSEKETMKGFPSLDIDKLEKKKEAREDSGKVYMRWVASGSFPMSLKCRREAAPSQSITEAWAVTKMVHPEQTLSSQGSPLSPECRC